MRNMHCLDRLSDRLEASLWLRLAVCAPIAIGLVYVVFAACYSMVQSP